MNGSTRKRIASAICLWALRVAPPEKTAFTRGMLAELDHVSNQDAVRFAAGCLSCAVGWRLATEDGITRSARFAIAAGTASLALTALVVAFRVRSGSTHDPAWALVLIGFFHTGAALVAWRCDLNAVLRYSVAGLALNSLALFFQPFSGVEPSHNFLQALIVEEYAILGGLIGLALGARWIAGHQKVRT